MVLVFENLAVAEKQLLLNLISVRTEWIKTKSGFRTARIYHTFSNFTDRISQLG
ncbi:hypothetical protein OAF63_07235 [Saprospiraceae bacterium]|jgi:hypothetical protein|nr:hypothetical protein [Saprospiraceae bacterium]